MIVTYVRSEIDIALLRTPEVVEFIPCPCGTLPSSALVLPPDGLTYRLRVMGRIPCKENSLRILSIRYGDLTSQEGKILVRPRSTIIGPLIPTLENQLIYAITCLND